MSDNSPEIIIEMIDIFTSQVDEFYAEMKSLLKNKEYDLLGKQAHKAKSSVAIVGMESMAVKLKEFELLAKEEKNISTYADFIEYFKKECDKAVNELSAYKEEYS